MVSNATTLHLSFGYYEQRLQWVLGNACKKTNLLSECVCIMRVGEHVFPHSTLTRAFVC